MRIKFTKLIPIALLFLVLISAMACKQKDVKKIMVDNQFAISLYRDTIFIGELFNQLDSTTTTWLRVDDDGNLSAFYKDTILGVVNASDFMDNVPDVDIDQSAEFSVPSFPPVPGPTVEYVIDYNMDVPLTYEEYSITSVELRSGVLSLNLTIEPQLSIVKKVELQSTSITLASGEMLKLEFNPNGGENSKEVDLANSVILPDMNQNIPFIGKIYIEYDPQGGLTGGDYQCIISGGITNLNFKTLTGTTNMQPVTFSDKTPIDFGVSGLSGSVWLPTPDIDFAYLNTFGCNAQCDVNLLNFYSSITAETVNLLGGSDVNIELQPTSGQFYDEPITGFTSEINALGQYTELNFGGDLTLNSTGIISISDTSRIDLAVGVDLPLSFNITDLDYRDTIAFSASGENGNDIQNYLDQIDFFIDFDNQLPLNVTIEAELLNTADPSFHGYLFKTGVTPNNTIPSGQKSTLECSVTDDSTSTDLVTLEEVLSADQIVLHFTVSTDGMQTLKMEDYINVGVRILTHTSEIDVDDVL
ncbi:MAG: hypothetical protein IKS65_07105 [Bacteroidales bacterium]|nr:hypothetical protein [Bacteroidales bacterium]